MNGRGKSGQSIFNCLPTVDLLTWEFLPQGAKFNPFHLIPLSAGGERAGEKN